MLSFLFLVIDKNIGLELSKRYCRISPCWAVGLPPVTLLLSPVEKGTCNLVLMMYVCVKYGETGVMGSLSMFIIVEGYI